MLQFIVCAIGCIAGDLADFVEAAGIGQERDPFADRQFSASSLSGYGLFAAHFLCQPLAPTQFFNRFLPTHAREFPCFRYARSSGFQNLSNSPIPRNS